MVYQDKQASAFMDIFPLTPGHGLVTPMRHAQYLHELPTEDRVHLIELGNRIANAQRALWPGCDLNWIVNDGKIADQHIPHVHLHLMPRHKGDKKRIAAAFGKRMLFAGFGKQADADDLRQKAEAIAALLD